MVSPLQISQVPTLLRFVTSFNANLGEVVLHWRLSPETCRQKWPVRLRRGSRRCSAGSLESEESLIPLIGSAAVSIGMGRGFPLAERHKHHDCTCRGENSMQTRCLWQVGSRSTTVPPDSPDLPGLAVMDWQRGSARTGTDQAIRILHYRLAPLPS
jgi:hypothetical protein